MENNRTRLIFGDPQGVRARLCRMVSETGADEVMVTTMVHGHTARLHSYALLAQAFELPRQWRITRTSISPSPD